jgi:hypothetical protein
MTNRELLRTPPGLLDELGRQQLFVLRLELTPMPCPCCRAGLGALEAAGIDLDRFDFGVTKLEYRCPRCGAELEQVVPAFNAGPLWHWELKPEWLRQQVEKARRFDEQARQPNPPSS